MVVENKSETQIIEEKVNRYNYDGFFHYLVTGNDEIRLILCQRMVTGKKLVETKIEKSTLYGTQCRQFKNLYKQEI